MLSSDFGIAEKAQLIVAELECHTDVAAEAAVGLNQFRWRAGNRGTNVERPLDRVGVCLEQIDFLIGLDATVPAGFGRDIEQLAAKYFSAHRPPGDKCAG